MPDNDGHLGHVRSNQGFENDFWPLVHASERRQRDVTEIIMHARHLRALLQEEIFQNINAGALACRSRCRAWRRHHTEASQRSSKKCPPLHTPKSGTGCRASLKRLVKFATQITSVSSTICCSVKCFFNSSTEPSRMPAAPRVTRSA